jgi:hypothetical protein
METKRARLFATRPRPRGVPPGGVCSRRRTNRISSLAARGNSKANPTSGRQRNACGPGGTRQPDRSWCRRLVGLPCRYVVGRAMIERVVLQRDDHAIASTPRFSRTGFIRASNAYPNLGERPLLRSRLHIFKSRMTRLWTMLRQADAYMLRHRLS